MSDDTQVQEIKVAIMQMLDDHTLPKGLTFAQIDQKLGKRFALQGGWAIEYRKCTHILLWVDMSEAYFRAYRELMSEKAIYVCNTNPLTYYIDGKAPNLPVAENWNTDYKHDHWMPMAIYKMTPSVLREFGDTTELNRHVRRG
jgi:hypothetical protein